MSPTAFSWIPNLSYGVLISPSSVLASSQPCWGGGCEFAVVAAVPAAMNAHVGAVSVPPVAAGVVPLILLWTGGGFESIPAAPAAPPGASTPTLPVVLLLLRLVSQAGRSIVTFRRSVKAFCTYSSVTCECGDGGRVGGGEAQLHQ